MNTISFRLTSLLMALFVSLGVLAPTAANAEQAYPTPAGLGYSVGTFSDGQVSGITFKIVDAPANTSVVLQIFGCADTVVHRTTESGSGSFDVYAKSVWRVREQLGSNIRFVATFSAPGYSTGVLDSSIPHPSPRVGDANCANDSKPSASQLVTQLSEKRGILRVGNRVKLTPTLVSTGRVSYKWLVGGQVVDRDRVLRVTKSMAGKRVVAKVRVTSAEYTPFVKKFRFGTVRPR